mmetsp:Transcript_25816/g.65642  ORF Transcript_25816/g.65642 Transcript_25816/m.65642 type:complete len:320 (-) Transcript_25816:711-1670(-)|eukprot:CAMPEP_0202861586 /NCGR_PEP_ID=MMETSP1391-20130828/2929_1 /ASSEMBLY_ACC=CAM_ASM_000867 /TAXON_ID=1034604 /ORGANISM="Chlamydomonas leiostraca, Strain SAG 11-49" /LENGTH=319 /DNA_ID=CAMNT_0049541001 /DNA_START=165 /DNA_END=1124 /DNA_ORIENTATION=-
MVHIPFFNIDVPEPRIDEIMPEVVEYFIRFCSRSVDAALEAVYPLTQEEKTAVYIDQYVKLPREFDRVIERELEGKIKNEDMLSSELEDASFDYYRRLLRRGVIGRSDEGEDEYISRQLGNDQPSVRAALAEQYANTHPHMFSQQHALELIAREGGAPGDAAVQAAAGQLLTAGAADGARAARRLQQQAANVRRMRSQVRTRAKQAGQVTVNTGLGIGLGLLIFRGIGLATREALKALKRARKAATSGGRPAGTPGRPPRATPAASVAPSGPATPAKPGAGGAGGAQKQQGTPSSSSTTTTTTAAAASSRRARPTTRTR